MGVLLSEEVSSRPGTSTGTVIYICIPTHNEESTIGVLLWKVRNVMGAFGRDYELLVLDDASTDGTWEVLQRYRRTLPLRVFRSEEKQGYHRVIWDGRDRTNREVVPGVYFCRFETGEIEQTKKITLIK